MRLMQYTYSINNFIICLQSTKLHDGPTNQPYIAAKKNISALRLFIIKDILNIKEKSKQEKIRLRNIIQSYSVNKKNYYNKLSNKYIIKFIYQYNQFYRYIKINKKTNQENLIQIISLTYIYTIYRLIKSYNPIYIYYLLTKK